MEYKNTYSKWDWHYIIGMSNASIQQTTSNYFRIFKFHKINEIYKSPYLLKFESQKWIYKI